MSLLYRNWLGRDARLEALLKLYGLTGTIIYQRELMGNLNFNTINYTLQAQL